MALAFHVGTSGWHYPHWAGTFYPPDLPKKRWLDYYAERFDTVELNNTFYRLPTEAAVENWRDSSPDGFCFAPKASRYLTHMKKLKDPEAGLAKYFERIDLLGPKLGPILFQLPPSWGVDEARLRVFLAALPKHHRYAFEFRDPTWNQPAIYELLRRANAGYCIFELNGFTSPLELTANFTYVRLHGPGRAYQGSYSGAALAKWVTHIKSWGSDLEDAYVYFDNDQAAYAARNALTLKGMLQADRNEASLLGSDL